MTQPTTARSFQLLLDTTDIKGCIDSSARDCADLIAIGIQWDNGKSMILEASTAPSKRGVHWTTFLTSLRTRSIGIPKITTSHAHAGLKATGTVRRDQMLPR